MMELKRWREVRNIPLVLQPKHSPSDDAAAVRLVIAAKLQGKDAHRLSLELGRALWERDESLAEPAVIAAAAQRAGVDVTAVRASAPSDAELDRLYEQYTQEALATGVFGAPSFVLPSGEIFWGQDRLEMLEQALKMLSQAPVRA
jgi:2-hydroxychromene-2-carboxylate isomerase